MSATESPVSGGMRRSHRVALVLLGTAGVVGLAAIWDSARRSAAENAAAPAPAPVPIGEDRVYANNDYIPGIGYYHAPYHAWFPHPFNYYDSNRGYFAGGLWQAAPWIAALAQSQPSPAAVSAALAARRAQEQQQQAQARSGFSGGGYRGSGFSSHPTSAPSSRPSIIRGGFGGSAHPSGS